MRRKLTTLKAKQGHSQNGAPRQLIDESVLRESLAKSALGANPGYDSENSGLSNPSRPQDQAISIRSIPTGGGG